MFLHVCIVFDQSMSRTHVFSWHFGVPQTSMSFKFTCEKVGVEQRFESALKFQSSSQKLL
jgi:hypothetical protein